MGPPRLATPKQLKITNRLHNLKGMRTNLAALTEQENVGRINNTTEHMSELDFRIPNLRSWNQNPAPPNDKTQESRCTHNCKIPNESHEYTLNTCAHATDPTFFCNTTSTDGVFNPSKPQDQQRYDLTTATQKNCLFG